MKGFACNGVTGEQGRSVVAACLPALEGPTKPPHLPLPTPSCTCRRCPSQISGHRLDPSAVSRDRFGRVSAAKFSISRKRKAVCTWMYHGRYCLTSELRLGRVAAAAGSGRSWLTPLQYRALSLVCSAAMLPSHAPSLKTPFHAMRRCFVTVQSSRVYEQLHSLPSHLSGTLEVYHPAAFVLSPQQTVLVAPSRGSRRSCRSDFGHLNILCSRREVGS